MIFRDVKLIFHYKSIDIDKFNNVILLSNFSFLDKINLENFNSDLIFNKFYDIIYFAILSHVSVRFRRLNDFHALV